MILFTHKWQDILAYLFIQDGMSITKLNLDLKATYSHTSNIIKELERRQFVNTIKKGRVILITLTRKGKNLGKCCTVMHRYIRPIK